jgi:hypothetical protein
VALKRTIGLWAICLGALWCAGCGQSPDKAAANPAVQVAEEWWCEEHGVPEAICAQCNFKLVADFKANGDWCKEHDRPDSQCFLCHPEKEAEFAAQYEAKYGTKPPKPKD